MNAAYMSCASLASNKIRIRFSKEICGGPHVEHTGELEDFHILKEKSIAAGL